METENYREMEQALNGISSLCSDIPCHCRGGPCKKKGMKQSFCFCISGRPYENEFSTAFQIYKNRTTIVVRPFFLR